MFEKDVQWINQNYFYYTDKSYNTQSTLELCISMNTSDNKSFSSPTLLLVIKNNNDNSRRVCSLKYEDTLEILDSIDNSKIITNPTLAFAQSIMIDKKFKGKILKLAFQNSKTEERIAIIRIIMNESDFGTVVLPFEKFITVFELLKMYKDNYLYISMEFPKRFANTKINEKLEEIKKSIQLLPTQISIPTLTLPSNLKPDENSFIEEPNVSDFDKFVVDTIDTIEIPEIEKAINESKLGAIKTQEFSNNFIQKVLKNDISVYESMMLSIVHTEGSPIKLFIDGLKEYLDIDDFLPGISDQDRKSVEYISKYIFKATFLNYLENNVPMPSGVPIIRYSPTHASPDNVELAYDIMFLNIFIRCIRNKIETKVNDADSNKSILNIAGRCFLDILSFSFLHGKDHDLIKNCLLTRFKNYKKSGFLDNYLELPSRYNCTEVSVKDFIDLTESVCENMLTGGVVVQELHKKLYDKGEVKLPPENNFELEQILNPIISLELDIKFGKDISGKTSDKEILKIFEVKPKTIVKKTPAYTNSLHRFVCEVDFIKQIPSGIKDKFLEYVKNLKTDFDFNHPDFIIDEFGDDVVKAIYVWNEAENKKMRYSTYRSGIEYCMDKKLILAKIKGSENIEDHTGSDDGDWV